MYTRNIERMTFAHPPADICPPLGHMSLHTV